MSIAWLCEIGFHRLSKKENKGKYILLSATSRQEESSAKYMNLLNFYTIFSPSIVSIQLGFQAAAILQRATCTAGLDRVPHRGLGRGGGIARRELSSIEPRLRDEVPQSASGSGGCDGIARGELSPAWGAAWQIQSEKMVLHHFNWRGEGWKCGWCKANGLSKIIWVLLTLSNETVIWCLWKMMLVWLKAKGSPSEKVAGSNRALPKWVGEGAKCLPGWFWALI